MSESPQNGRPSRGSGGIVDLIDNAIDDWLSVDAMRWAPPAAVWDEPVVRSPRPGVERLIAEGWDGYAANAYFALSAVRVLRALKDVADKFGQAVMQIFPNVMTTTKAINKLVAAHEALDHKRSQPRPFWTVQPQRERRR